MKIVTAIPVKERPANWIPNVNYIENEDGAPSLCRKLNKAMEWAKEQGADWL